MDRTEAGVHGPDPPSGTSASPPQTTTESDASMVTPASEPLRPRGRRRRRAGPARTNPHPANPAPSTDNATDLARDLESRHPGWVTPWRRRARRYRAFPLWLPNAPGPIEARNVQDLLTQMNDLEPGPRPHHEVLCSSGVPKGPTSPQPVFVSGRLRRMAC
ncbi:hypothetical protein [Streptosporangium sp. CA-115845]|uniref:hypothetical protein n=1 Tax=Streptosporangium sp. CA-115845 TaxID=3240071 RepID=UPI003D8A31F6